MPTAIAMHAFRLPCRSTACSCWASLRTRRASHSCLVIYGVLVCRCAPAANEFRIRICLHCAHFCIILACGTYRVASAARVSSTSLLNFSRASAPRWIFYNKWLRPGRVHAVGMLAAWPSCRATTSLRARPHAGPGLVSVTGHSRLKKDRYPLEDAPSTGDEHMRVEQM